MALRGSLRALGPRILGAGNSSPLRRLPAQLWQEQLAANRGRRLPDESHNACSVTPGPIRECHLAEPETEGIW